MKVAVISMWYNEETLAPLFLNHYAFADEIRIILDMDMDTDTLNRHIEIIEKYDNAQVLYFKFPAMMDAELKHQRLQKEFDSLEGSFDWGITVDADEFIFPLPFESVSDFLARQSGNIVSAAMWQVFRHITDKDIDPLVPAILQRQHGDPDMTTWYNSHYIKPCIGRTGTGIIFGVGCHTVIAPEAKHCSNLLFGTHWKMADPVLAIERRIKNGRDRQSIENKKRNHQCHDFNITEQEILVECEKHKEDPLLFNLEKLS